MKSQSLYLFSVLISGLVASASPLISTRDDATYDKNKRDITDFFSRRLASLNIVKTTTTSLGQTIDWIPIESQGKISSPPPLLEKSKRDPQRPTLDASNALSQSELGPPGTVPVLRPSLDGIDFATTSLADLLGKTPPPAGPIKEEKRDDHGIIQKREETTHRYATTLMKVENYGGEGWFNVWAPTTEPDDFSLMQLAVIRSDGGRVASSGKDPVPQTVEAGWQVSRSRHRNSLSHLFVYFTTNGYNGNGDNIGGYDRNSKGWIQVDQQIFPGQILKSSTIDGNQYEIFLSFMKFGGDWWLRCNDRWIGYYPGSLFSDGKPTFTNTLGDGADRIDFFGEIYDSPIDPALTTTDMGSGQFPSAGFRKAAFITNMIYQSSRDLSQMAPKNFHGPVVVPNPPQWDIETHFRDTGSSWGSHVYLGGPGRTK